MRPPLISAILHINPTLKNEETTGHAQRRDVQLVRGVLSALAGRGVSAMVSFVSVPLTVRYLGAERYGAWIIISTAIAWIALADLGLSNSLTNAVSEGYAQGREDLAQHYVAAAFWSLAGIAALLSIFFFPAWQHVPWDRVFNVRSLQARQEVGPAVAVAFAIFAFNLPFSITGKIYGAYQEVAKGNAWAAAGNLLGLAALIAVTRFRGGLVSLVIAVSGTVFLVNVISAVWLFTRAKRWLVPRLSEVRYAAIRKLTSLGGMFFVIQAAGLVLFQTDNLIIAHYLGAAAVTPYSVTWKLFTYTALFQILAGPAYWPAYAEAFARGDIAWVRRRFKMNLKITIASTLLLVLPLMVFGRFIIERWAGRAAVPPAALLLWMGLWSLIYSAMNSQSCLLSGSGRVKIQTIYSAVAALVNLGLSLVLVQRMGLVGVIIGTVGAYLICIVVPQTIQVERSLRG